MSRRIGEPYRGDVYFANLGSQQGSVEHGVRPVLIVQNNVGNLLASTIIVVPLTTQIKKLNMPGHTILYKTDGIAETSMALCEQITTIDKSQIGSYVCHLGPEPMKRVTSAIISCVSEEASLSYREQPNEMVLTLCPTHRNQFLNDPMYRVRRLDPMQTTEPCTLCQRSGFDYLVINIGKNNPPKAAAKSSESI